MSPRSRSHQCGLGRIHKSRPKGLNQVKLSPNPKTTRRFRTQLNSRSNVGPVSNLSEQRRPEPLIASIGATQPPPTSGEDLEHPLKGGGQMDASPGRPA